MTDNDTDVGRRWRMEQQILAMMEMLRDRGVIPRDFAIQPDQWIRPYIATLEALSPGAVPTAVKHVCVQTLAEEMDWCLASQDIGQVLEDCSANGFAKDDVRAALRIARARHLRRVAGWDRWLMDHPDENPECR